MYDHICVPRTGRHQSNVVLPHSTHDGIKLHVMGSKLIAIYRNLRLRQLLWFSYVKTKRVLPESEQVSKSS